MKSRIDTACKKKRFNYPQLGISKGGGSTHIVLFTGADTGTLVYYKGGCPRGNRLGSHSEAWGGSFEPFDGCVILGEEV